MSYMPINEIRGDHLFKKTVSNPVDISQIDLKPIAAQVNEPILSADIKNWLGLNLVSVRTSNGLRLYNAETAQPIKNISEQHVQAILKNQLKPGYQAEHMNLLETLPNEARGREVPLWQVQLDDSENTRIYISAQSGKVVATRTDRWRLFDFMWMLHIMDYDERSDFNHPLLYITAFSALMFTITGFILVFFSLRQKKITNR